MKRALLLVTLGAALSAAPFAFSAPAFAAQQSKAKIKVCKHKTASGKVKTWRCRADQPCCSAEWINYYTCGSKLLGCL